MQIEQQHNGLYVVYLEANKHYTLKKSNKTGRTRLKLKGKFKKDLIKCGVCYNFLWGPNIPPTLAVNERCKEHLTYLALKW